MIYEDMVRARFLSRPNRFIALAQLDGDEGGEPVRCHVKNTGRCRELLVPGVEIWLRDHAGSMGSRRLRYSLIAVKKKTDQGDLMVNIDSQAPNALVREALEAGIIRIKGMGRLSLIKPETVHGDSRFDFYVRDEESREGFIEVKGVTLERDGFAAFPDAPTERGVRHIEGLIRAKSEGYAAAAVFVIQMEGMTALVPNYGTHPAFGEALKRAREAGAQVSAFECAVDPAELHITKEVPVILDSGDDMKLWEKIKKVFGFEKKDKGASGAKEPAEYQVRYACPVCGAACFDEKGGYEICPVCGWEDDPLQRREPDFKGGANEMSLNEAKEAWKKKGTAR